LARLTLRDELGNEDGTRLRELFPPELDLFDLVKRFGGEVALAAVWADHQRNIFNEQQILTLAKCFGDPSDARSGLSTIVANQPFNSAFHIL
jgi:hypothetical protein